MEKLKAWFSRLFTSTRAGLSKFFEGPGGVMVRQALGTVVEQAGAIGLSMLMDAARGKATQLNQSSLPNAVKRTEALDYLRAYALQQGITVSESLLRYTLETAVVAIKGEARQ